MTTQIESRSGGGPRTPEGKETSSRNAINHGILSPSPTAGGESIDTWQAFLEGYRDSFQPVGAYEEELTYRIAIGFWRLRRVDRAEVTLIDRYHPKTDQHDGGDHPPAARRSPYVDARAAIKTLSQLALLEDDSPLTEEQFCDVLEAIGKLSLIGEGVPAGAVEPTGTVAGLRRLLVAVAETQAMPQTSVAIRAISVLEDAAKAQEREATMARYAEANRAAHVFMPQDGAVERLIRYQTAHEHSIGRMVKALEVSQRARNDDLPPPIRLEVVDG